MAKNICSTRMAAVPGLALLLLTLIGNAEAGPQEDVASPLASEVYATELDSLRALAEQGDADAQFNLGRAYNKGEGVQQDYAEAMKWYRLAAEQGDDDAQFYLGRAYNKGEGVQLLANSTRSAAT